MKIWISPSGPILPGYVRCHNIRDAKRLVVRLQAKRRKMLMKCLRKKEDPRDYCEIMVQNSVEEICCTQEIYAKIERWLDGHKVKCPVRVIDDGNYFITSACK